MIALRFALALAALFLSSPSFSAGYWFQYQLSNEVWLAPTPQASCARRQAAWTGGGYYEYQQNVSGYEHACTHMRRPGEPVSGPISILYRDVSTCPSQLPYEWADGLCHSEPEPAACEADKLIEGVGYPSSSNSASSVNFDGCQAVPVGVTMCRVDTTEPGGWRCVGDLRLTGDTPPPETPEVLPSPDIASDPQNDVSGSETSDTSVEPTVTQPDGTLIDVATVTNLAISAAGVSISENPSTITVIKSDGVTTETETTVTVTTNPDGSYSERTDTVVTITNPGGSRTLVTKSDGSITLENIPSGSRTDTTSRTDYFDSNGRKIGSTGSSGSSGEGPVTVPGMGSGDGAGGGQGGEGDGLGSFCDWADIVCQLADWFFDEPLYPDNPEVPFTDITMDDVDEFDSGIGAGQCPADNVISTRFGNVPISWELPCQLAETFRPIVLFFAWITALYIVVRVK